MGLACLFIFWHQRFLLSDFTSYIIPGSQFGNLLIPQ
jgi:hypothetical protein